MVLEFKMLFVFVVVKIVVVVNIFEAAHIGFKYGQLNLLEATVDVFVVVVADDVDAVLFVVVVVVVNVVDVALIIVTEHILLSCGQEMFIWGS